ncbi:MAG: GYD domain-containing protein [Chloroflexi bacterium]|nr:GYD domain-containing protein [Chloroflexota bacterium]
MARYMYQVAYTDEAWGELVKKPVDRVEAIKPAVRKLGGKIETAYFTFGDYDLMLIASMPDDVSAAALSIAASAGGAVKSIKTTPLMTVREGMRAMRQAKRAGYSPPGA